MNWLGQAGPLLSAISGIDIALWDIKGKSLGAPVYELLGGAYRRQILLYANYWFLEGDHTPADYARQARQAVERGFTALKLDPFALGRLTRFLRRKRFDVVQTWVFAAGAYGRVAARLAGVPVVVAAEMAVDLWKTRGHLAIDPR